jgi:hypothetical protein
MASTSIGHSHLLRRNLRMPPPVVVIVLLFTENAANSSLGINGVTRKRRLSANLATSRRASDHWHWMPHAAFGRVAGTSNRRHLVNRSEAA